MEMTKSLKTGNSINGTGHDDWLYGDGFAGEFDGRAGNDWILGYGATYEPTRGWLTEAPDQSADEYLFGGAGNDTLAGGAGSDVLDGGSGSDLLYGGSGVDVFMLSPGADSIVDFSPGPNPVVRLDFEGWPTSQNLDGYRGLTWGDTAYVEAPFADSDFNGYDKVLNSGLHVMSDGGAAGISFSDTRSDFDFLSGFFAAAWSTGLVVTLNAFDDGQLVGIATFELTPYSKAVIDFAAGTATGASNASFSGRFTSVDTIAFDGSGGADPDRSHVAVDDLLLRYATGGDGDRIDVPDDIDVSALIAGAFVDRDGGTILSHVDGFLQLIGIAPEELQAQWFV